MAAQVHGRDCVEAWQAAVKLILTNHKALRNLVVEIEDPSYFDDAWANKYNPAKLKRGTKPLRDVVNTIFPQKTLQNSPNRKSFYTRYLRAYKKGRIRNKAAWGTYFQRLVDFGPRHVNQLEKVIDCLRHWKNQHRAAFVFHLSAPDLDSPRPLGAPCWQFGELLCHDDNRIDLVAVYRSHDYFSKALGNFIGLGRLLDFICKATRKRRGKLICHSIYAFVDPGANLMRRWVR